jgi:class 3 adenylate cyclase
MEVQMPIFMDRHFTEGATAHAVANAHQADLALQGEYGVRFLTYWFDEARSTAFCLVDSPDEETITRVHAQAHGLVPNEVIEVDPSVVESFLGRVSDPVPAEGAQPEASIDSALRAIMFTDLKDSTLMTSRLGDERALHLLHVNNAMTRNALREHGGREVKHTGDGIMASAVSVPDSVRCAMAIQRAFREHNSRNPGDALMLRIGLHAGEPIEEKGDLFGSAVQLAARLCAACGPGEILVSEAVKDLCADAGQRFKDRGLLELKGIADPVRVFEVQQQA